MKIQHLDPTRPRCPGCNEPFTLAELKQIKRAVEVCDYCRAIKDKLIERTRDDEYNLKCLRYQ